jgi:hypothetical protein
MNLRQSAWHCRLFLHAFAQDRGWLEWFRNVTLPKDEPREVRYLQRFERTYGAMKVEQQEHPKVQQRLFELNQAADRARERQYQEARAQQVTARSQTVRDRLMSGRMSLCPYFWSVVSAVLIYGLICLPTAWFFQRALPFFGRVIIVLMLVLLIGSVTYYSFKNRGQVPVITQAVTADLREVKARWDAESAYNRQLAAEEQHRKLAAAQWAKQHPDEVRSEREAAAAARRVQAEAERRAAAQEWKQFWADLRPLVGIVLAAGVVGIVALILAIQLLKWLLCGLGWLLMIPIDATVNLWRFLSGPEDGRTSWIGRGWIWFRTGAVQRWTGVVRFLGETKELIWAFWQAKKERVCPYLTVTPE